MVLFHHEMAIFKVLNNYTNGRALFVLQPDGTQDTAPLLLRDIWIFRCGTV